MPLYSYQCLTCHTHDQRIAGVDDHTALCVACGELMLRTDEDIWMPLWVERELRASEEAP